MCVGKKGKEWFLTVMGLFRKGETGDKSVMVKICMPCLAIYRLTWTPFCAHIFWMLPFYFILTQGNEYRIASLS